VIRDLQFVGVARVGAIAAYRTGDMEHAEDEKLEGILSVITTVCWAHSQDLNITVTSSTKI